MTAPATYQPIPLDDVIQVRKAEECKQYQSEAAMFALYGDFNFNSFFNYDNTFSKISASPVQKQINRMYDTIENDKPYFNEEGINPPNEKATSYAKELLSTLAYNKINPAKISTLAEEGIAFKFQRENKIMHFEIYNNGEIGYIIEDFKQKKTLENRDIFSFEEAFNSINSFLA